VRFHISYSKIIVISLSKQAFYTFVRKKLQANECNLNNASGKRSLVSCNFETVEGNTGKVNKSMIFIFKLLDILEA